MTEAGKILYENCQNFHNDLKNIVETVKETHKRPRGKIKIAALQNVSNLIIAPILDKFFQQYPDIEVFINLDKALGPVPDINEYDVAFRSGKQLDSTAISRLFFKHEYVVGGQICLTY